MVCRSLGTSTVNVMFGIHCDAEVLVDCIRALVFPAQTIHMLAFMFPCAQVTQTHLDTDMVKAILSEYKIHNANVTLRMDATDEDLIDTIEGNRVYMPCIYVLNKIDQISIEVLD